MAKPHLRLLLCIMPIFGAIHGRAMKICKQCFFTPPFTVTLLNAANNSIPNTFTHFQNRNISCLYRCTREDNKTTYLSSYTKTVYCSLSSLLLTVRFRIADFWLFRNPLRPNQAFSCSYHDKRADCLFVVNMKPMRKNTFNFAQVSPFRKHNLQTLWLLYSKKW